MAHQATAQPDAVAASRPSVNGSAPPPVAARRHPPRQVLIPLALVVVATIATAYWLGFARSAAGPLTASGTIEFDEITLAAESAGRIADLSVAEGSRVTEGQVVGHLVDPVLDIQSRQSATDPAQQQLTQAQLARMELVAPQAGVVQKQIAHRGEYVGPGGPILTVADPTNLKLTLYVVESELGRVSIGQTVSIRSDAFADRTFTGVVSTIADRAEFTPRNVQTPRDRQNLVFAVTVQLANADGALKAGLPVDATFTP